MYSPVTPELVRVQMEERLREAERFRLVSQALRERKAMRRAETARSVALLPLRRAAALTASLLFRAGH